MNNKAPDIAPGPPVHFSKDTMIENRKNKVFDLKSYPSVKIL